MTRGTYSGKDVVKALQKWRFRRVGQTGSHVKLRYIHPNTDEKRTVIVPMHDELDTGTLQSIAKQAGADDFQAFLDAIDELV
ncbi:type II toxin-antitoxin system HicA family toxin [Haloarchaeobius sp. DT45]|uniref:type II toxin-antitoxin system HicA family toxin n=1 Tax=Haloarchaeobius sp. DT45 TaxID=3446116 RepID=UPI003F6BDBB3